MRSGYDFQAHQQRSQRRCCSQTAILWFEVLPSLSSALPGLWRLVVSAPRLVIGAPRLVVGTPRLVVGAPRPVDGASRRSQVVPNFSPALRGVPKLITITPMVLLYQSSEIAITPNARRNALLGADTLLKSTHLSLHSTSSQTLLEALSDKNTFCWCSEVIQRILLLGYSWVGTTPSAEAKLLYCFL